MTAFRLTVESDDLGRIFTNALAFFPANSQVKTALLRLYPQGYLEATGTDTYTLGRDSCKVRDIQWDWNSIDPIEIELNREGWLDIESQARKDRGNTGLLEFIPGDVLIFHPGGKKAEKGVAQDVTGQETATLTNNVTLQSRDVWSLCDELLERMAERPTLTPEAMTFDPDLFTRFRKVRAPAEWEAEKVIDFWYQGQGEPMLAKIGPSFVGAIMPVTREKYVAAQGAAGMEGLW